LGLKKSLQQQIMAHSRLALIWENDPVPIVIGRKGNIHIIRNLPASERLRAIFAEGYCYNQSERNLKINFENIPRIGIFVKNLKLC